MKFEQAEHAVQLVEAKLVALDNLATNEKQLAANIELLRQSEAEMLHSEDKKRVEKLLKIRAELDVASADINKVKAQFAAARIAVIDQAIACHNELCLLRDEILAERKVKVKNQLEEIFTKQVVDLAGAWVNYAKSVKAVWQEHFTFMRDKPEMAVLTAKKLKPLLEHLKDPDFVAPVKAADAVPVPMQIAC